ncbi:MAG: HAD hydrolase family protein [Candidatus Omnitrophica bacterium]|nr:HAD hydrolase family protein [Candidatus Omnitrophota bacterium]
MVCTFTQQTGTGKEQAKLIERYSLKPNSATARLKDEEGLSQYLFASDFDGTLRVYPGTVPSMLQDRIAEFLDKGGRFAIITGQVPSELYEKHLAKTKIIEHVKYDGQLYILGEIGGLVGYCDQEGRLVMDEANSYKLSAELRLRIRGLIDRRLLELDILQYVGTEKNSKIRILENKYSAITVMIRDSELRGYAEDIALYLSQNLKSDGLYVANSGNSFIDISLTSKGAALKGFARRFDISLGNVLIAGDSGNDIEMLNLVNEGAQGVFVGHDLAVLPVDLESKLAKVASPEELAEALWRHYKLTNSLAFCGALTPEEEDVNKRMQEATNLRSVDCALVFDIGRTLVSKKEELYKNFEISTIRDVFIELIEKGFKVVINSGENFADAYKRIIQYVPQDLRREIIVYINDGARKIRFLNNAERGDDAVEYLRAYQTVILEEDVKYIAGVLLEEIIRLYREKIEEARVLDPQFDSKHQDDFLNANNELRDPEIEYQGRAFSGDDTKIAIKHVSSPRAARNAGEIVRDIRAEIMAEVNADLARRGLSADTDLSRGTIIIKRQGITKATAIKDLIENEGVPASSIIFFGDEFEEGLNPNGDNSILGIPEVTAIAVNRSQDKVAKGALKAGAGVEATERIIRLILSSYAQFGQNGTTAMIIERVVSELRPNFILTDEKTLSLNDADGRDYPACILEAAQADDLDTNKINNYYLPVPEEAQKKAEEDYGRLFVSPTFMVSDLLEGRLPETVNRKLRRRIKSSNFKDLLACVMDQISLGPGKSLAQDAGIVFINTVLARSCVAAVNLRQAVSLLYPENTIFLHTYYFDLSRFKQVVILYHELKSHIVDNQVEERLANADTQSFALKFDRVSMEKEEKLRKEVLTKFREVVQVKAILPKIGSPQEMSRYIRREIIPYLQQRWDHDIAGETFVWSPAPGFRYKTQFPSILQLINDEEMEIDMRANGASWNVSNVSMVNAPALLGTIFNEILRQSNLSSKKELSNLYERCVVKDGVMGFVKYAKDLARAIGMWNMPFKGLSEPIQKGLVLYQAEEILIILADWFTEHYGYDFGMLILALERGMSSKEGEFYSAVWNELGQLPPTLKDRKIIQDNSAGNFDNSGQDPKTYPARLKDSVAEPTIEQLNNLKLYFGNNKFIFVDKTITGNVADTETTPGQISILKGLASRAPPYGLNDSLSSSFQILINDIIRHEAIELETKSHKLACQASYDYFKSHQDELIQLLEAAKQTGLIFLEAYSQELVAIKSAGRQLDYVSELSGYIMKCGSLALVLVKGGMDAGTYSRLSIYLNRGFKVNTISQTDELSFREILEHWGDTGISKSLEKISQDPLFCDDIAAVREMVASRDGEAFSAWFEKAKSINPGSFDIRLLGMANDYLQGGARLIVLEQVASLRNLISMYDPEGRGRNILKVIFSKNYVKMLTAEAVDEEVYALLEKQNFQDIVKGIIGATNIYEAHPRSIRQVLSTFLLKDEAVINAAYRNGFDVNAEADRKWIGLICNGIHVPSSDELIREINLFNQAEHEKLQQVLLPYRLLPWSNISSWNIENKLFVGKEISAGAAKEIERFKLLLSCGVNSRLDTESLEHVETIEDLISNLRMDEDWPGVCYEASFNISRILRENGFCGNFVTRWCNKRHGFENYIIVSLAGRKFIISLTQGAYLLDGRKNLGIVMIPLEVVEQNKDIFPWLSSWPVRYSYQFESDGRISAYVLKDEKFSTYREEKGVDVKNILREGPNFNKETRITIEYSSGEVVQMLEKPTGIEMIEDTSEDAQKGPGNLSFSQPDYSTLKAPTTDDLMQRFNCDFGYIEKVIKGAEETQLPAGLIEALENKGFENLVRMLRAKRAPYIRLFVVKTPALAGLFGIPRYKHAVLTRDTIPAYTIPDKQGNLCVYITRDFYESLLSDFGLFGFVLDHEL